MKRLLLVSPDQELLRILFELSCSERDAAQPRFSVSAWHEDAHAALARLGNTAERFDIVFIDTYLKRGDRPDHIEVKMADALRELQMVKRFVVYAPARGALRWRYEQDGCVTGRADFLSRPGNINTILEAIKESAGAFSDAEL